MLRLTVIVLLLANAGYYAWSQGHLAEWGLAPAPQGEPQRLQQQIRLEAVRLAGEPATPPVRPAPAAVPAPEHSAVQASAEAPAASVPVAATEPARDARRDELTHVDAKGEVKVIAADTALDCGPQINPERIRAQMEGGVIMGLSLAMSSEISFEKGRVKQSNFHDYEVLRHAQQPGVIRTHLVGDSLEVPPGGVGEPPLPAVAPALANAIFAATGKRVRALPIRQVS